MGSTSPKEEKPKQNETEGNVKLIHDNKPLRRFQEQSHHKINIEKPITENEIKKPEEEEEKKEEEERKKKKIKN